MTNFSLEFIIWAVKSEFSKGNGAKDGIQFFHSAIYRQMLKLFTVLRKMNLLFISLKLTNLNIKTDSQTNLRLCIHDETIGSLFLQSVPLEFIFFRLHKTIITYFEIEQWQWF